MLNLFYILASNKQEQHIDKTVMQPVFFSFPDFGQLLGNGVQMHYFHAARLFLSYKPENHDRCWQHRMMFGQNRNFLKAAACLMTNSL